MVKGDHWCLTVKTRSKDATRSSQLEKLSKMLSMSTLLSRSVPGALRNQRDSAAKAEIDEALWEEVEEPSVEDDLAGFHPVPDILLKPKRQTLLAKEDRKFFVRINTPGEGVTVTKAILLKAYYAAKYLMQGSIVYVCPPAIFLEDMDVCEALLTTNMKVVAPFDGQLPEQLDTFQPVVVSEESLDTNQAAVYQELKAIVEVCEFICYWSKKGWYLSMELEQDG